MFCFLPVESILRKLPVVPVGDIETIPKSMWQHAEDFVGAARREPVTVAGGSNTVVCQLVGFELVARQRR